jgi:arsenate reductase (thioredoxin)
MNRRYTIAALLTCLAIPLVNCQRAPQAAESIQTVVFVCPYGSAKSVVAARFFNRMATERALPFRAVARGLTPEDTIPPYVREPIRADGFEIGVDERPVRLEPAEIRDASVVVCIKCQLSPAQSADAKRSMAWADVPDVDAGYGAARDRIVAHLNELVSQLTRESR